MGALLRQMDNGGEWQRKAVLPMSQAVPSNLNRLAAALSRGLHVPVRLEGTEVIGFAVRLDDAPFGPVAVVHVPEGRFLRVLYRDPEELAVISSDDSLRFS